MGSRSDLSGQAEVGDFELLACRIIHNVLRRDVSVEVAVRVHVVKAHEQLAHDVHCILRPHRSPPRLDHVVEVVIDKLKDKV
jgi:hypothetical protein